MLTITIDWLAGTFKEWTDVTESFIRTYASFHPLQAGKPRLGYSIVERDSNGAEFLWNSNDNRMGYHAVFSGTALRNLFELHRISPLTLLHAAIDAGLRVSRLDLAKDATGKEIDGEAVYKSLEQGIGGGNTRTFGRIVSNDHGDTIYIGSRQSERFIRVYNKAAQTGDFTIPWWRMEIETKGDVARLVSDGIRQTGNLSSVYDAISKRMVGNVDAVGLQDFFSTTETPFGLPKIEKKSDREKWIAEQVVASVAKHYIDNPNSEAVKSLIATLLGIDKQRKE